MADDPEFAVQKIVRAHPLGIQELVISPLRSQSIFVAMQVITLAVDTCSGRDKQERNSS